MTGVRTHARWTVAAAGALLSIAAGCGSSGGGREDSAADGGAPGGDAARSRSSRHDSSSSTGRTRRDGASSRHDAPVDSQPSPDSPRDSRTAGDAGKSPIPPGLTLLFTGDFETGDLSQWAGQYPNGGRACVDGGAPSMTVYDVADAPPGAPSPRQGRYAVKFHTLNADVAPCTTTDNPRTQLQTSDSLEQVGDELWEQWSVYFPEGFPIIPTVGQGGYLLFQEDYGAPFTAPPALAWDVLRLSDDGGDLLTLAHAGIAPPYQTPLVLGRWVDLYVHKKLSLSSADGFVEAWVDGVHVPSIPFATLDPGQTTGVGFYLSSYRYRGSVPGPVDLYLDNAFVYRVP